MRRANRAGLGARAILGLIGALVLTLGCATEDAAGPAKSAASVRAARRAYDGAPPTVPHGNLGIDCASCHNERGMAVEDLGFAPPSPHALTAGMSEISRCRQCHVDAGTAEPFVDNGFEPLRQDLRRGRRHHPYAPPTLPHRTLMRENCQACHTGPAAREAIRTTHPERPRCRQCHVAVETQSRFPS